MQKDGYRQWLATNGRTAKAINTRTTTLLRLERKLGELGIAETDLDAIWAKDRYRSLNSLLDELLVDTKAGGSKVLILSPATTAPEKVVYRNRAHLKSYSLFLEEQGKGIKRSEWTGLERLRNIFHERNPDFLDFSQTSGSYFENERLYKNELMTRAQELVRTAEDVQSLGRQLHTILEKGNGALLRWQTRDTIEKTGAAHAAAFFQAIGEMANSKEPVFELIFSCVQKLQLLHDQGLNILKPGEIWATTLTVSGFVHPQDSAPFKISIARYLGRALNDDGIFAWGPPLLSELKAWLDLLHKIEEVMRVVWGWKPRDLIDVQGFVWITVSSAYSIDDDEEAEQENLTDEPSDNSNSSSAAEPVNLIFYGPPGTGKTFLTASEAVNICDGPALRTQDEVRERYQALRKAGQIAFVTFHQSYAYEDFVEGLRPVRDDTGVGGGGLRLEPRLGAFREICLLADIARTDATGPIGFDLGNRRIFKMSLGRAGTEDFIYDACLEGNYIALGWGGKIDWSDPKYVEYEEVAARWRRDEPTASGNKGDISQTWRLREMKEGDLVVVSDGNTHFRAIAEVVGPYQFAADAGQTFHHRRPVRWLLTLNDSISVDTIYDKPFIQHSCYLLNPRNLKREALARLLGHDRRLPNRPDQFVLIIDEINRANISKVFGELITLIEPDKRLGQENPLTVRLPYTGDDFGVPDNLHIIGTMNTADRSIALLDTALRRRFEFREIIPNPELLDKARNRCGIDLVNLLRILNNRIEYIFDREHRIGHAYFMGCKSKSDVDTVMRNKVIPLLCEYFYEDWEKVAIVLGDVNGKTSYLEQVRLPTPAGSKDTRSDVSMRWTVKAQFADDVYDDFS